MSSVVESLITRDQYIEEVEKWKKLYLVSHRVSLIPYYGGKYNHIDKYLPYIYAIMSLNQCNTYIEMTGGGARFLLNLKKEYFNHMIYNEMDLGLCSLFQCVSSQDYKKLMDVLNRVQMNKELFDYAAENRNNEDLDDFHRAFMTYISAKQSYNANLKEFSTYKGEVFSNEALHNISRAHEILKDVMVLNGDCNYLLDRLGSVKHTIKMIDPPYHPCTRESNDDYPCEMTSEQHRELAEKFSECSSGLMCGYDPAQYGCNDYKIIEEKGAFKISMGKYTITSAQGKADISGKKKEEFIWVKL